MATTNGTNGKMPQKTREESNHHKESSIWNDFKFRPDDIIITTYAESGTTIVSQLIHQGDPTVPAGALSPWVDMRIVPKEAMLALIESQTHRRLLNTHLPLDDLVWSPQAKYIFIARNGRDMLPSAAFFENTGYEGQLPVRPSENPKDIFDELVKNDMPNTLGWPFWSHIRGWWEHRDQPNVLLVYFNDLKADLEGGIKRIAKFLEIPDMPEEKFKDVVEHSTFDWMKEHAHLAAPPQAEVAWANGAKGFIYQGTNSRW
ncbi:N-hydroxyarylamine sulfotransferase, partial [Fusarium agapanthi]